jgi:hypothetical protein
VRGRLLRGAVVLLVVERGFLARGGGAVLLCHLLYGPLGKHQIRLLAA